MVGGVNSRGSGVAFVLRSIIHTFVHLIVVPNIPTTFKFTTIPNFSYSAGAK